MIKEKVYMFLPIVHYFFMGLVQILKINGNPDFPIMKIILLLL